MKIEYPKNQTWTEEEAKIEKSLLFHDFIYAIIKYPILFFTLPYVTSYAIVKVLIDNGVELCKIIK